MATSKIDRFSKSILAAALGAQAAAHRSQRQMSALAGLSAPCRPEPSERSGGARSEVRTPGGVRVTEQTLAEGAVCGIAFARTLGSRCGG